MRINPQIPPVDSTPTNPVADARSGAARPAAQPPAAGQLNDTVQLSSSTTTVRQLLTQLEQVPEIRQEKVSSLRSQIQSGQFQRSNEQVAGAMVNELLGSSAGA